MGFNSAFKGLNSADHLLLTEIQQEMYKIWKRTITCYIKYYESLKMLFFKRCKKRNVMGLT